MASASITWNKFDLSRIELFLDPVYDTYVEKETFLQIYLPLLQTLDGRDMTSYMDWFFTPSPLADHILVFVDEDAKLDFQDMAMEMNLLPSLKEIMEGEDTDDKDRRRKLEEQQREKRVQKQSEVQQLQQQRQQAQKKKATARKPSANNKRSFQAAKSLDNLMKKLELETDPLVRKGLNDKINRTLLMVDKSV